MSYQVMIQWMNEPRGLFMNLSPVISLADVYKSYPRCGSSFSLLKSLLLSSAQSNPFHALTNINMIVNEGDVIGIIGKNGSGKSTLLQLICGTLYPTSGTISVKGRIAALLELGAGFNPEFTGRENIFLSTAIVGLSKDQTNLIVEDIIDFSGIREFIDQPVKTYSSGMYVRLAFSVAVSVEPDILVIDEALAVGDGEFSRKSFEKVMELKKLGKTILFCSHAMYQIEALCNRVIWLDHGNVMMIGQPDEVVVAYSSFLESTISKSTPLSNPDVNCFDNKIVHVTSVNLSINGNRNSSILHSKKDTLQILVSLSSPGNLPIPTVAVMILDATGKPITSTSTQIDAITLDRDDHGQTIVECIYPEIALLKGHYSIDVFLLCEQGIHVYEHLRNVASFDVQQSHLEMGVVSLPHIWH